MCWATKALYFLPLDDSTRLPFTVAYWWLMLGGSGSVIVKGGGSCWPGGGWGRSEDERDESDWLGEGWLGVPFDREGKA